MVNQTCLEDRYKVIYIANLRVTMVAGMSFTQAVKGIRARMIKNRSNLNPQSTSQVPFLASPDVWPVLATQAQLE